MKRSNAGQLAFGGLSLALVMALLFAASILPISDLTVLSLAGGLIYILSRNLGIPVSIMVFVASVLLGILLLPNKVVLFPYAFCFGPYAVLKRPLEHLVKKPIPGEGSSGMGDWFGYHPKCRPAVQSLVEILLKAALAGILVTAGFLAFGAAFLSSLYDGGSMPLLVVGAVVLFLLYDYILTLFAFVLRRHTDRWKF
jgi:hypothetical protein